MRDYDVTYGDFNPEVLFACKRLADQDGVYHCHDFFEITYIVSGQCEYVVDGVSYKLAEGDVLLAKAGMHHQYKLLEGKEPAEEFYVGFRNFHFKDMEKDSIRLRDGGFIYHCKGEMKDEMTKLCYAMEDENAACKLGKYFMLKSYLIQMIIYLIRENVDGVDNYQAGYIFKSSNKSYIVKKIISFLNDNYNKKISLDQIAHNMYLSPVYISKLFKEETGESPINYLIKIRLEKAKEILDMPEGYTIKWVAKQVGYDDVYYFSKLFKKYYGEAPLYYRRR